MPAKLILFRQNEKLGLDLKDGVYRIGRDKPADIVIPDATISGNHAEVQISGSTCTIRDLGSTNGTFLNGSPVRSATPVKQNDELRLGSVKVAVEFPQEIRPLPQPAQPGPSVPTVKMEAVKTAVSKVPWAMKYWLAGAEAILFLLVLFFFVQIYTERSAATLRRANRFKAFASQYMHVLTDPSLERVPPPVLDSSLGEPILIIDRTGKVLHPPPLAQETKRPSPLIDPKTKALYPQVKAGLTPLSYLQEEGLPDPMSYPVQLGGDLLGFVIARPVADPESPLQFIVLMLAFAGFISFIVLFFTLQPVTRMVRAQIEALRVKMSPLVNGFVEVLPRSRTMREINDLADEIEKGVRTARSDAAAAGQEGGAAKQISEYLTLIPELLDSAHVPYCFVGSDFQILGMNRELNGIRELAGATKGVSIFDTGLTSVQSKQLVQAIADARTGGSADVAIPLSYEGSQVNHQIWVRSFTDPRTRSQIFGIIFNRAS